MNRMRAAYVSLTIARSRNGEGGQVVGLIKRQKAGDFEAVSPDQMRKEAVSLEGYGTSWNLAWVVIQI